MAEDIREELAENHPDFFINEHQNDAGSMRIIQAFEDVVEKIPAGNVLTEKFDVHDSIETHIDDGQVYLGLTSDGVEALVIGTGVQPLILTRDGVVGGADELDTPHGPANYNDYYGLLTEHADRTFHPHRIEMPGDDEPSDDDEPDDNWDPMD